MFTEHQAVGIPPIHLLHVARPKAVGDERPLGGRRRQARLHEDVAARALTAGLAVVLNIGVI